MEKIFRRYKLCKDGYECLKEARSNGYRMREIAIQAVEDALKNGLEDELTLMPYNFAHIELPEVLYLKMQAKAIKMGISTTEYLRRAVRQYAVKSNT